jgi:hypothetical protein
MKTGLQAAPTLIFSQNLDQLHYKVENALLKLIESFQKKQTDKKWRNSEN